MSIPKIAPYAQIHSSEFPSNKAQWHIDPKRCVLLVHDMQNYFVDFYNRNESPMAETIDAIKDIKEHCKRSGIPVIYSAQPGDQDLTERALLNDFWGPGLAADPALTDIVSPLSPADRDILLTKWRYSAFAKNNFSELLEVEQKDQIIIVGIYAHIGILTTALDGFMRDKQVFVVGDAVADFSREEHLMALNMIAGRCGQVTSSQEVLASNSKALTFDQLRKDIADITDQTIDDIDLDEALMYSGLDSIRAMNLIDRWKNQGVDISFSELAEQPTLKNWWSIIEAKQAGEKTSTQTAAAL